jgi:hypothetical protein
MHLLSVCITGWTNGLTQLHTPTLNIHNYFVTWGKWNFNITRMIVRIQQPKVFRYFFTQSLWHHLTLSSFFIGLWGVINNAGVCVCGEFEWMTWDQIQKQIDVNFVGTVRVTKAFISLLKPTKGEDFHLHLLAVYHVVKHTCMLKMLLEWLIF